MCLHVGIFLPFGVSEDGPPAVAASTAWRFRHLPRLGSARMTLRRRRDWTTGLVGFAWGACKVFIVLYGVSQDVSSWIGFIALLVVYLEARLT